MKYFKKEMIRNPATVNGIRIPFDEVGDNEGILATEDPNIIAACEHFISKGIGGVSEIALSEFEVLKKKEKVTRQYASGGRSVREPMPHRGPETQLIKQAKVVADVAEANANANAKEKVAVAEKKDQSQIPTARPARIQRVPKI